MSYPMIVSNLMLWIAVVGLSLLLLALTRQVGILFERIAPAGALQPINGPKVGDMTKSLSLTEINGNSISIGGAAEDKMNRLILFVSPSCPVCKTLTPTAKSLASSESSRLKLIFASDGFDTESELAQHKEYATKGNLFPYILSKELGINYQVSKLPFAVLIDANGVLRSKGLVNTREHMESLIEAMDSGVATVQEYVGNLKQHAETTLENV